MSEPCEMRLGMASKDCGKPATLGFAAEEGGRLIPVCEDCRKAAGIRRCYLLRLDPATRAGWSPRSATPEQEAPR